MKKLRILITWAVCMILLCGCGEKKKDFDLSDAGKDTAGKTTQTVTETPTDEATPSPTEEVTPTPDEPEDKLPEGWTETIDDFSGDDIQGFEKKTFDERGRQRKLYEEKKSVEYDFNVAFVGYYTYTDGSPDVLIAWDFFTYDWDGNMVTKGHYETTYTMQSPDNYVESWVGFGEPKETDENGIGICYSDGVDGTEYAPTGAKVKDFKTN
ncbi:MAG: hypothetical protein K6F26_00475 [Lachnospiraceae bacterium]|nr:hypothetical protein [Lachnospiraceae bacterium]